MSFYEITNSLIFRNTFQFVDINKTTHEKIFEINAKSLESLTLSITFETMSHKIVDKHVFKNIKKMFVHGTIEGIDEDMFQSFKKLRLLFISSNNFNSFFHQTGTKWINSINNDINVSATGGKLKPYINRIVTLEFHDKSELFKQIYAYPNEDICLFKEFPNDQLVYPVIMIEDKFECTCTLAWLTRYYMSYITIDKYMYRPLSFANMSTVEEFCAKENNLTKIYRACNFTSMFENCEIKR